ncbi:MAG: UDP-4-amino-4,6-dideoxy-N-acetyl-beta-L-altrosamine transaminase [Candidatus Micrarchaeia archaeon]
MIPYGKQTIEKDDVSTVGTALTDEYLTTGPRVREFEQKICEYVNSKFCVAVNSGTSALDIAVASLGLPPGSEIITTPFTFAASANCILYNNCKPVFADINPQTYNIDPEDVRKRITSKTKAIICVDYAGQPCDLDELKEIAEKHNLYLIEDAAHSLGAEYKGKKIGGIADITAFSFHPVKIITTGEGGAVTTNDEKLYQKMKLLRNHGIDKTPSERADYRYDMKILGRNYRITDFQCALGISQIMKIDRFIERRTEIANKYTKMLDGIQGIKTPYIKKNVRHAWHLYTILVKSIERDRFFGEMRNRGIGVNVHYIPVYKFTYYKQVFGGIRLPNVEEISSKIISLPIYPTLKDEELEKVVGSIKEIIGG